MARNGKMTQERSREIGDGKEGCGNAGELRCATDSHVSEGWVAE